MSNSNTNESILKQKIMEYEKLLAEKNLYLAKLEMDLEHLTMLCKKIANANSGQWIKRQEPGLETK